ncbi:hypothetical protein [Microvirga massiliensis]|uniref:hypothetical protein n=1 Tax=Microvirga massiliensis TaxID=1033741 RepID=UPI00065FC07C|nr:hypothetical protein [Microvirga massiliensis]
MSRPPETAPTDHMLLNVGAVFPHVQPGQEGMKISITAGEAPSIMFVVMVAGPTNQEVRMVTKGKLRLGLTPSPPLLWFSLLGEKISFDAPYAIGVEPKAGEILKSVNQVYFAPPETRLLTTVLLLDARDCVIRGIRAVTVSPQWWLALDTLLARCEVPLTQSAYLAAMQKDMQRWPSTAALARDAGIIEHAGAV